MTAAGIAIVALLLVALFGQIGINRRSISRHRRRKRVADLATEYRLPHVLADGTLVWFVADGSRVLVHPDGSLRALDAPAPPDAPPHPTIDLSSPRAAEPTTAAPDECRPVRRDRYARPVRIEPTGYRVAFPPHVLDAVADALEARPSELTPPDALRDLRAAAGGDAELERRHRAWRDGGPFPTVSD